MKLSQAALVVTVMAISACTTTGNIEKDAAIGAATGAAAGAVIGNNTGDGDARTGAVIGGVVGAVGGAVVGHEQDRAQGEGTHIRHSAEGQALYYDQTAGRYYYFDTKTGKTYWQNGQLRG